MASRPQISTACCRSSRTGRGLTRDVFAGLKDWSAHLAGRGSEWQAVALEDIAGFVAWLPPQARDGKVAVLPTMEHQRTSRSHPGRAAKACSE